MPQEKILVAVVDDTDESREMILRMLQFDSSIEVVGTAKTGLEAVDLAQKLKPDVIVMDINMPDMDGITATENIRKKNPYIQVVILSVQSDANYMRRAMLAGARDFLTKPPMIDELTAAIRRAGTMAKEEKAKMTAVYNATGPLNPSVPGFMPQVNGKIIVVYSPKGGSGTTTIATNLAVALKDANHKVALVDSNLMFGDVAVFFNEHGKNSALDLIDRINDLDAEIISDVMIKNKVTGIEILGAPNSSQFVDAGIGESFAKILQFLQNLYDYVIVDTTAYLTEVAQNCLDIADFIVLVTIQDIPAIKNTNQFLSLADASGIGRDRIVFIMNRYDKRISISPERVGESLKQPVIVAIPYEDRAVSYSVNRGIPFMIDNKMIPAAKSIVALADHIREKIKKLSEVE
ncbi:Chemotaxis response regulator protein-glutamate methylesterase [bioreactor metagenome]|uniref:Chemotaxis response regulator protein-glutamate methylesterase n=1 Tax=bioreactor metagenome TaxID=1076179 RepID=A0A644Z6L9_9ZZZZ